MLEKAISSNRRACVFTGPVFTDADPTYQYADEQPVQIPAGFWKVIVLPAGSDIKCASFLVWQRDYDSSKPLAFSPVLEQVRLTTLEVLTGLSFNQLGKKDVLYFKAANLRRRESTRRSPRSNKPQEKIGVTRSNDIIF